MYIKGGNLDLTGNLVIIGEGNTEETTLEVDSGGSATIVGSMFMGSDWNNHADVQAELEIDSGSTFTLTGLMTLMSPEAELEFEPGGTGKVSITGMLQIAVPPGATESNIDMEFEGDVDILKDDAAIQIGLDALMQLDTNYTIPSISQLVETAEPEVLSWRRTTN